MANAAGAGCLGDRCRMEHIQMLCGWYTAMGDRLFPLEMPRRITQACGSWGELIVLEGFAHNEPYLTAAKTYWQPVIERILRSPMNLGN